VPSIFPGVDLSVGGHEGLIVAQQCLPDNEKRDAFAAQYSVLSRLWEALSPDSVIVPHTNDYSWLTKVYESVKPPVGTASCFGMPWEQKLLSWCIRTSISKRLLTILKLW